MPPVVALGVVPRQPVVEEVVEEGRASLLAEPRTKSPLKQNPTGKYQKVLEKIENILRVPYNKKSFETVLRLFSNFSAGVSSE